MKNVYEYFAHYTECQLATVEQLRGRKSTSKSDLRRQEAIAQGMLEACKEFGVRPRRGCPRLEKLIESGGHVTLDRDRRFFNVDLAALGEPDMPRVLRDIMHMGRGAISGAPDGPVTAHERLTQVVVKAGEALGFSLHDIMRRFAPEVPNEA